MNLVLVSNYLNTHMIPLCDAFINHPAVERFTFIATTPFSEERKKMGFEDVQDKVHYVYKSYENSEQKEKALWLTKAADVAIIAAASDEFVHIRMRDNKVTFLCSERFYKLGLWRRFVPSSYRKKEKRFLQYRDKQLYYLTIGAYAPYDLKIVGFPPEKCFQWAYFPQIFPITEKQVEQKNSQAPLKLFWAGRMLSGKHPEVAIKTAIRLKQENIDFELNMAGDGPALHKMSRIVRKYQLQEKVHLLRNCSPDVTQKYMSESNIFLFTSNYWEGWGATLSEAMGVGCVPIASSAAGASEVLIQTGTNGFLYHKVDQIADYVMKLNSDKGLRKRMAINAWETINKQWTASMAVDNFIKVIKEIKIQSRTIFEIKEGPMKKPELRKARNYFGTDF